MRLPNGCLADVAQGRVSSFPEHAKHRAMHVLQGLPLAYLVLIPPCDSLSRDNPLMEKKHLGAGGSQLHMCCAKGGPGSVRTTRRFIQPGPKDSG